jgi:antitoxin HicB
MKAYNYRVLLTPEPEGGFTVMVPTLPGCITYGETIDECIDNAKEAIELYIESLEADGEVIPTEEGVLEYNVTLVA